MKMINKMCFRFGVLVLVGLLWLMSCAAPTPTPPPVTPTSTATLQHPTVTAPLPASPTATPNIPPKASPTPEPPLPTVIRPRYTISAALDYGRKTLAISEQVEIPHPGGSPDNIVLIVQPNWYPGVFDLGMLAWGDGVPVEAYSLEGIRLTIPLDSPWQAGETRTISMTYSLNLPPVERGDEFGPNPFGYTNRQVNLTDWHPFVPPFINGEWVAHTPWFYGEHLVYPLADYTVEIQLANAPDSTVIAASGLDRGEGDIHRYQMEATRTFVWSVSPEYRVYRQQVGDVILLGYGFPFDAIGGEAAFQTTVEAFEFYSQQFGPYPHESLSMVQADFNHGMEYNGLYFLSRAFYNTYDGSAATYLVAIAAHETSHQWWFGVVGNDQALEPWLDEAFATFSERLFYENLHPEALDWWLAYRVNYYEPQGLIDGNIYDYGGYRPYRDAVYLNGMNFLTALRAAIGEDVFTAFLQDYLTRESGKIATADDFFAILSEHSDADIGNLLVQYFR